MIVSTSVADLRARVGALRQQHKTVAVVPTMGALHAGHLELVRRARAECDSVVLTIFVNPTQFNDAGDLAAYPRDEQRDLELAQQAGVDVVFLPTVDEVYPDGFGVTVALRGPLVETLEGAQRGVDHFHGVITVVAKLFGMTGADRAYFGEKDAQQLRVVQAMARDLNIDIDVVPVPTVRDTDGLALSSRNVRLAPDDRERALAIPRALQAIAAAHRAGEHSTDALQTLGRQVLAETGIEAEYVAVVDEKTFRSGPVVPASARVLIAAPVGPVRLIDNLALSS